MSRVVSGVLLGCFVLFAHVANALEINFGELGNGQAAVLDVGFGVSVSGSADVQFADFFSASTNGGLGIGDSGVAANSLDAGEFMRFDFGQIVDSVLLTIHDIPPPGNVFYSISAMLGALDLGQFNVPLHTSAVEVVDVSALVGGPLDALTIAVSASAPLGLVIERLAFEPQNSAPVSAPGALVLWLAALGVLFHRRRSPRLN